MMTGSVLRREEYIVTLKLMSHTELSEVPKYGLFRESKLGLTRQFCIWQHTHDNVENGD